MASTIKYILKIYSRKIILYLSVFFVIVGVRKDTTILTALTHNSLLAMKMYGEFSPMGNFQGISAGCLTVQFKSDSVY